MVNTSIKTQSHYFKKIWQMPDKSPLDYRMKRMASRLHEEFDKVWVQHEKGKATFEEWEKSLNKWLQAELI